MDNLDVAMEDLRNQLNEAQWRAVEYIDGPQMVIAGAGSGKTRVLTFKIAFLLSHGMYPWNILALTFTNKAAREMKERIARQVGEERAAGLWMGTFHSIFARILRRECAAIGYDQHFTIYDQTDSQALVKTIIKEMMLDEKVYVAKNVAARISKAKEGLKTPDVFRNDRYETETNQHHRTPLVPEIYSRYQARLRQANAMDFDDLLMYTYLLFRDHEDIRRRYVEQFRYILVDEYQDTNYAQHAIVRQLACDHGRLCVVGDDAQSIYSFRGANIDNILTLAEHFPTIKTFKLEQNYRSTQTIVEAANSVIAKNRRQIPKHVFSQNDVGEPLQLFSTYSDIEEADVVVRRISALARTYSYSDIAILYRTNSQSRTFEEALRKVRMPYRIYGGLSFYQRKEIKDAIAYCRLAVNPSDEEALRRVINYPARGIGNTTLTRLSAAAGATGRSMWSLLADEHSPIDVTAGTRKKLTAFAQLIRSYMQMAQEEDAAALMSHILNTSGIRAELNASKDPDDEQRRQNVEELINACHQFVASGLEAGDDVSMASYLQEVSLLSSLDEGEDGEGDDKVTLMTIHASKGLEFPVVFVVGMDDEIFPGERASESVRALEEERRLFYVAITRAAKLCYLTNAKMRRKYGQLNYETPSRFLRDIDPKWISARPSGFREDNGYKSLKTINNLNSLNGLNNLNDFKESKGLKSLNEFRAAGQAGVSSATRFAVGDRVSHPVFGCGTVKAVAGRGLDEKLTITFDNVGTKVLLTRFAKLSRI